MENPFDLILRKLEVINEELQTQKLMLRQALMRQELSDNGNFLNRKEVAKYLKVSIVTLHSLMKNGLPFKKVGRRTLFDKDKVQEFINNFSGKLSESYNKSKIEELDKFFKNRD